MGDDIIGRVAAFWDGQAASFDEEPDHGLPDGPVRRAWEARLRAWLPEAPVDVADLGCGTGTLSVVLAGMGHRVTGVDVAGAMVERARAKARAAALDVTFHHGDATAPPVPAGSFDVVLARHLLWTLPAPERALENWCRLLRPGGRLVLVEGRWAQEAGTEARDSDAAGALPWSGGVDAVTLSAAVRPLATTLTVHDLGDDATLWGRPVHDERFALVAVLGGR